MIPPAAPQRKTVLPARSVFAVEDAVIELVRALVRALRPQLFIETGAGEGTLSWVVAGELSRLGEGRLVSVESDPEYAANLRKKAWWTVVQGELGVECRPLEKAELVFLDSKYQIRAREIEAVWDFVAPGGLVLVHDANRRHRDLWEPLLGRDDVRVVFIPTDRGLAICEKLNE